MKHLLGRLLLPTLLTTILLLSGCSIAQVTTAETKQSSPSLDTATLFSDRDLNPTYDSASVVPIQLSGTSATCDSTAVSIDGGTISIQEEGIYVVSGILSDGQLVVNAPDTDKVQIVLNAAEITSADSAAIYVLQADKVFVTLADGTENTLTNGGTYTTSDKNKVDAVIFSKSDFSLNGTGSLTINAATGHGVVSKDELVVASGNYTITAAEHGMAANDSIAIADGSFQITSGKDAFHSEYIEDTSLGFLYVANGSFTAHAKGDAFSASGVLQIENGNFTLTAGGGSVNGATHTETMGGAQMRPNGNGAAASPEQQGGAPVDIPPDGSTPTPPTDATTGATTASTGSGNRAEATTTEEEITDNDAAADDTTSAKGLRATGGLVINGGTFTVDSADDALHTNGNMSINNGIFTIKSGDDGLHADASLNISGGTLTVTQSYEGMESLAITLSGGDISIIASDDGLNAGGGNGQSNAGGDPFAVNSDASILISGGTLTVNAEGDGIDSNGSLTVSGGTTCVYGPTNGGNGALDYSGEASITGGILIAFGASQMAQNFGSASTQGSILVSFDTQGAGSTFLLTDSSGNTLLSQVSEKNYSSVVASCPALTQGERYTVTTGASVTELTLDSLIYGSGGMGGQRPDESMSGKRTGTLPNEMQSDPTAPQIQNERSSPS